MRVVALIISGAAGMAGMEAVAQTTPAEVFAGLTGACWRSPLDGTGPDTDTHCFAVAVGGKMVTDTNKVRNPKGEVVYEGVAIYRLDKASGALAYDYYNSSGDLYKGYGWPVRWRTGNEIWFGSKPGQAKPDIVWKLSKDSYDVTPASSDLGHPGTFVKLKPGQ